MKRLERMQKEIIELEEIQLVGIQMRTSYEVESNPEKGKISSCVMRYFHEQLFEKIPHRKKAGTTYCAYTDYESDYRGAYTYFIGEEVSSVEEVPEGFAVLTIPAQTYAKFTVGPGPMPGVLIKAWQDVWKMTEEDQGGKRRYHTDFEIYDERASDHSKVVLDLLIGIDEGKMESRV